MNKPFLKYAGNKAKLADRILAMLPPAERLVEPFVGSGAVFLNGTNRSYVLSDTNSDLMNVFRQLWYGKEGFIKECADLFTKRNNTEKRYYKMRDAFNAEAEPRTRAALFLYLNQHCYNGLCRYNAMGKFNVPYGHYKQPRFPETEMIYFMQKSRRAEFVWAEFGFVMGKYAEPGTVFYCDPPYSPLSETANFANYTGTEFVERHHRELVEAAKRAAAAGSAVLISNHDTPHTRQLYKGAKKIITLDVTRTMSCKGGRKQAPELLALYMPKR